ncbi:MAG: hypothetical protein OHK0015_52820 [Chloroflexi bacterium OHK40]
MSARLEHDWFPQDIPANVVLGAGCWLHSSYALLHFRSEQPCGLRIGAHSGIYVESCFVVGPQGEIVIGDYCTLAGPIIATNRRIVIGSYVFCSREVVISDEAVTVPEGRWAPGPGIVIGDDAWIGARAVVLGGAQIGVGAIVGAGAVVDGPVPDYAIVAGNPARIVGWARP